MKTPILEESASWMALVSATTPDSSLPLSAPSKKAISKRTRAVRYCRRMRFACRWLVVSQHAISRYAEPKAAMESQQNQRMIWGGGRGVGVPRAKGGGAAAAAGAGVKPPRLPKQLSPRAAAAAARTGLSTSLMRWLPSSAFTSAPKISVKLRGGSLVVTIKSIWHANGPMRAERHIHGKLRAPWESETVQNSCPKQSPQQPGALTTAHDAPGLHRAGAGGAESAQEHEEPVQRVGCAKEQAEICRLLRRLALALISLVFLWLSRLVAAWPKRPCRQLVGHGGADSLRKTVCPGCFEDCCHIRNVSHHKCGLVARLCAHPH